MSSLFEIEKWPHVPAQLPKHGVIDLMVIGEAPGIKETELKKPFVGDSGKLLRATLSSLGVDPDEIWITNVIPYRPPNNRTPTWDEILLFRDTLQSQIEICKPKKILACGSVATSALISSSGLLPITKIRGRGMKYGNSYLVPTIHPAAVLRDYDLFRDFGNDVEKWIKNDTPFQIPQITIICPDNIKQLQELLNEYQNASIVVIDLETTGLDSKCDTVISFGIGVFLTDKSVECLLTLDISNKLIKKTIKQFIINFQGKFIFHNAKFDLKFIYKWLNINIEPDKIRDTMLLHYMLDERPYGHSLKDLARIYFDAPEYAIDFKNFVFEINDENQNELFNYQSLDITYTGLLYQLLDKELIETFHNINKTLLVPAVCAFSKIEEYGVLIDRKYLNDLKNTMSSHLEESIKIVKDIALEHAHLSEFNPASSVQVKNALVDMGVDITKSVNTDILIDIVKNYDGHIKEFAKTIIDYRQLSKITSTFIVGLLERIKTDGRIHSDFLLHGTTTGRLSSQNPNLQNIPIKMGEQIRKAFIVPDNQWLIQADYNQLELRIVAHLSKDEKMITGFREGNDIHSEVASIIFDKSASEISTIERIMAKSIDFGILYGRSATSLINGNEMDYYERYVGKRWTLEEANQFIDKFLNNYPQLKSWMENIKQQVKKDQYIESALGRRRRFPLICNNNLSSVERMAVNFPVQSLASDFCLSALIRLHKLLPSECHILFSVHDAIYFEVPKELLTQGVVDEIYSQMSKHIPIADSEVPFPVDISVGQNWAEHYKPELVLNGSDN